MTSRSLTRVIRALATSDGAGVKLRRSLGRNEASRCDPFLMLDEFFSDRPGDYIAGFPAHPHRGFETVTYMLDGHLRHEDHLGNRGELKGGGAQWMTAGRGIIHSEMPQQDSGRMRGFQLWINLPAAEKMKPAAYRDLSPAEIPTVTLPGGGQARVIAGQVEGVAGPIAGLTTDPLYADLTLAGGETFTRAIDPGYAAVVYVYEGTLRIGGRDVATQNAGVLSAGDTIDLRAGADGARVLLLAARPLGEPVVQYGPFVMNSRAEIEQALEDYRTGRLTAA